MERNCTIDCLRTIAIFLVILLHVSAEYVNFGINNLKFDSSFWIANIVDSFTRICVPLFVLISGMFLVGRQDSFKEFYQKRTRRILIPLIFWTVTYLIYQILLSIVLNKPMELKSLLGSVILGRPYYHLWYLYMIIGLYLITPVLNKCIINVSKRTLWKVAILLLVFGVLNRTYNQYVNNKTIFILWFVDYLGYFILGYLIKDSKRIISTFTLISAYVISSALIAILSFYTILTYNNLYFYEYATPFVIIASLSIYKLFHQSKLKINFLQKISHLTLGIYLIHAGVLNVFIRVLRALDITTLNSSIVGIPIKFTVTLIVSITLAWFISKTKYLKKTI